MATRLPNPPSPQRNPPIIPQITKQSGHLKDFQNIPAAPAGQVDATDVLKKGRILYYYHTSKLKTKYGLCFLLKDTNVSFQFVSFAKPKKVKNIYLMSETYVFYSQLSLIDISQRRHYISAAQDIPKESVEYLLAHLLMRDWGSHKNDTPFVSITVFLHHITSVSANALLIKGLIRCTIDWSFIDTEGNSFIHAACMLDQNDEIAEEIIGNVIRQSPALINTRNLEDLTALAIRLRKFNQLIRSDYSSSRLVEYLLNNGATLVITKDDSENTVITDQFLISCLQIDKAQNNELIIAYELPKKGSFRTSTYLYSRINELNHCQITRTNKIQNRSVALLEILKDQFVILLLAKCPQILEYIFNPINDLLSKTDRDINGNTVNNLAIWHANPLILRHILTGYEDWNYCDEFGNNLIHIAINYKNFENLKELVSIIPKHYLNDLLFSSSIEGIVPYKFIMSEHKASEILIVAMSKGCVAKDGNNFVHMAVEEGEIECLEYLILNSPREHVSSKNSNGSTPLQLAVMKSDVQAVELLLENSNTYLDSEDNFGCNCLHNSIIYFHNIVFKLVLAVTRLIDYNPEISDSDISGATALHLAIDSRNAEIWRLTFEYLCTYIVREELIDKLGLKGVTLFQYAILQNYLPAVKDLFKLNPNLFVTLKGNNNNIIHLAVESIERVQILQLLLKEIKEEDLSRLFKTQNDQQLSPLLFAILNNNIEALRSFQRFNLSVYIHLKGMFLFEELLHEKLILCKQPEVNKLSKFLFGYKVQSEMETVFILVDIPGFKTTNIYLPKAFQTVDKLNENELSLLLQVTSFDFVKFLISRKIIDLHKQFSNSSTLLHLIAQFGCCSVLEYFIKYRGTNELLLGHVNIFSLDRQMNSILFYAMQNNNKTEQTRLFTLLLTTIRDAKLFRPEIQIIFEKENNNDERILEVAVNMNNFEAFKCLLDQNFQIELTYKDKKGLTLLHKIIKGGQDTRFLLALLNEIKHRTSQNYFNSYLNCVTQDLKQTALHLCVSFHQNDILKIISEFYPNFSFKDTEGNTPLHLAVYIDTSENRTKSSLTELVIVCIRKLEGDISSLLNAVNMQSLSPLHIAVINSNIYVSNLLLSERANLYTLGPNRKSVLHYAVEIENKIQCQEVINFLLDYEETHPNPSIDLLHTQDKDGHTPLHVLVLLKKPSIVKLLLDRNPNLAIQDSKGETVLHHSIHGNCQETVDLILAYIIDTKEQINVINIQDREGNSSLHIAIKFDKLISLQKLLSRNPILNLRNNLGQTPLHLAILQREEVFTQVLDSIEKKCYLSQDMESYLYTLNSDGLPSLHFAIMNAANIYCIEKLVQIGAKLSCTDKAGVTLFAGRGGLNLCIVKQAKSYGFHGFNIFQYLNKGFNWYVGFKISQIPGWVLTDMPDLNVTMILLDENIEEVTTPFSYKDEVLQSMIECECIDPIKVAIEKNLLDPNEMDLKGKKLLNYIKDKMGSAPVAKYVEYSTISLDEICFWIETKFWNLEELNLIFESIPNYDFSTIEPDSSQLTGEELKRNKISDSLSKALLFSLESDSTKYFSYLLSHNLCLNAQYGKNKDSLLHMLVLKEKSQDFLHLFLNKVCEYERIKRELILINGEPLIDARNGKSLSALALCAIGEQERTLTILLKYKPSLTTLSNSGDSILHSIAKYGNEAMAETLISKILNSPDRLDYLFNMPNSDGCIPLHLSVEKGNVIISELLLQNDSKYYSQDKDYRNLLHHAILIPDQTVQSSMIEFILTYEKNNLLSMYERIVAIGDIQDSIPLGFAIKKSSICAVRLLVPYISTLKHVNKQKQTILHLASANRNNEIFDEVINQICIQQERKFDRSWVTDCLACCTDEHGCTTLQLCIKHKNIYALKKLLAKRPCLNLPNCQWNSQLHYAIKNETDVEIRKILTEEINRKSGLIPESSLYTENSQGLPPLHSAIEKGNIFGVESLLKQGVKLAFKQKTGQITFWHNKSSLKLSILLDLNDKSIAYAGYEVASHTKWVVAKLPEINKTEVKDSSTVKPLNTPDSLEYSHLTSLFLCHSVEPLEAMCRLLRTKDKLGNDTLIEFAGKYSSVEVIKFFIEHFKIEVFERRNVSLLESATKYNSDIDVIRLILKYFPIINPEMPSKSTINYNHELIFVCLNNSLECSIGRDDTQAFDDLLSFGVKLDTPFGTNLGTILHLMDVPNASKFIKRILEWVKRHKILFGGTPFIDASNKLGETALHLFTRNQLIPHIRYILEFNPNLTKKDSKGNTALHLASNTNNLIILKLLVEAVIKAKCHSLLNTWNSDGLTPLLIAIDNSNIHTTQHLLCSGSSIYETDIYNQNALHHAVRLNIASKRIELINLLLEMEIERDQKNRPSLTRSRDSKQRTPLHLAIINQVEESVEILIKADSFVLTLTDNEKKTPLHLAVEQKSDTIVKMLTNTIQHEEIYSRTHDWLQERVFCMQDSNNKTAIHISIQYMNTISLSILLATKPCLDLKDNNGNSLLHYSVSDPQNEKCIDILLRELTLRFPDEMPQYLYAENIDQIPPLQYAIMNNHIKGVEMLIAHNVNLAYYSTCDCLYMCHGKRNLKIEFLQRELENTEKPGKMYEYFAGMKGGGEWWVACTLPDLEITALFKENFEVVKGFSDKFLLAILRSRSIEPFISALQFNYFTLDARFKDGRHFKHLVSQHASRQVATYFLTLFPEPVYLCENRVMSMIECAVLNTTDPDTLLHLLQNIRNNHEPKMSKRERKSCIDSCFKSAFFRSLDNETPVAFGLLLEYASRVDYRYERDKTFLHLIIEKCEHTEKCNHLDFIRSLFSKFKKLGNPLIDVVRQKENMETLLRFLSMQDSNQNTALHLAAIQDRLELVQTLLEYCPIDTDIINVENSSGLTALHYAVINGNLLMTEMFLHSGAKYSTTDCNGRTILHHAVAIKDAFNRSEVVKFLKNIPVAGHELTMVKDNKGYTPLHLAILVQSVDVIGILLQFNPRTIFIKDLNNHTPLHISIIPWKAILEKSDPLYSLDKPTFVKEIFDQIFDCINLIDKHGYCVPCDKKNVICCKDKNNQTAMHYAIQYKNIYAFGKLLTTGCCLDIPDADGSSLLHLTVMDPELIDFQELLTKEMNERSKYSP